ncbi:MAG: hypothetical protein WBO33_15485, partial [Blautia wexlerae]
RKFRRIDSADFNFVQCHLIESSLLSLDVNRLFADMSQDPPKSFQEIKKGQWLPNSCHILQ